jgi:hypothetical protein
MWMLILLSNKWALAPSSRPSGTALATTHAAIVSLYFMCYNFARVHQTLRVTPAMEAGIASHVWNIEEIVGLLR